LWQILVFWLPYYILNDKALYILSGNKRTQHWSNLIDTILFPYLIIPVILESLGFRKKVFAVTQKSPSRQRRAVWLPALPHIILLLATFVSICLCFLESIELRTVYNIIILFWLLVNGKNILLAVFFMLGRDNQRGTVRVGAEVPATVRYDDTHYDGVTVNLSEGGLCVRFAAPVYLPDDQSFSVRLTTERYEASLECAVSHVDAAPDRKAWFYSLVIVAMDEANRSRYMQIVFDRPHSLPDHIQDTLSVVEDFRMNIDERLSDDKQESLRKLPRVSVRMAVALTNGDKVRIEDFNFKYLRLSGDVAAVSAGSTILALPGGVALALTPADSQGARPRSGVYRIQDWRQAAAALLPTEPTRL
jgi:cellulose synthase (UDP-forming)